MIKNYTQFVNESLKSSLPTSVQNKIREIINTELSQQLMSEIQFIRNDCQFLIDNTMLSKQEFERRIQQAISVIEKSTGYRSSEWKRDNDGTRIIISFTQKSN